MITVKTSGDFSKTNLFIENALHVISKTSKFDKYGKMGVEALRENTPKDTGLTANSWRYDIKTSITNKNIQIIWSNDNIVDGKNVAILLQYGHATKNGTYVRGTDYINPAMYNIFKEIAEQIWMEVTNP